MKTIKEVGQHITHDVFNQPPPLVNYDLFSQDKALVEGVRREGATWALPALTELGAFVGREEVIQWGFDANIYEPVLHTYDRFGHRLDEVTFTPAYHQLMENAVARGMHASSWRDSQPGSHVARAAAFFLFAQVEPTRKANRHLDAAITYLQQVLTDLNDIEWRARYLVERMALVLQAALLVQHNHPAVADAFCASRLTDNWGKAFGTLPRGVDASAVIERARPKV